MSDRLPDHIRKNIDKSPLAKLLAMVYDGEYKCDYPDDPDVNNIITSEEIWNDENVQYSNYSATKVNDEMVYTIARKADILKEFRVLDINGAIEIRLEIGTQEWYKVSYKYYSGTLSIRPFSFGIPFISMGFHEVKFIVKGIHSGIGGTFMYLDSDERRKTAEDGIKWPNGFITVSGMFGHEIQCEENIAKRKAEESESEAKVAKKRKRN